MRSSIVRRCVIACHLPQSPASTRLGGHWFAVTNDAESRRIAQTISGTQAGINTLRPARSAAFANRESYVTKPSSLSPITRAVAK